MTGITTRLVITMVVWMEKLMRILHMMATEGGVCPVLFLQTFLLRLSWCLFLVLGELVLPFLILLIIVSNYLVILLVHLDLSYLPRQRWLCACSLILVGHHPLILLGVHMVEKDGSAHNWVAQHRQFLLCLHLFDMIHAAWGGLCSNWFSKCIIFANPWSNNWWDFDLSLAFSTSQFMLKLMFHTCSYRDLDAPDDEVTVLDYRSL